MGHVAIPYIWTEFLLHRGCSCDVTSILKSGLIAGGRESKEERQKNFFTPLNSFWDNPDVRGWYSVEVPSCHGSLQCVNGRVDNKSGVGEVDECYTGEVGKREPVLVFSVL